MIRLDLQAGWGRKKQNSGGYTQEKIEAVEEIDDFFSYLLENTA